MSRYRNLALALAFAATSGAASAADLTIWWPKGFVEAEDTAIRATVAEYEKTGKKVELSIFTQDDLPVKLQAALAAGEPPDLTLPIGAGVRLFKWAFEDELVELSDLVVPNQARFYPAALEEARLLDGRTGQRAYYRLPVLQNTQHVHVWRPLLEQAGYKVEDIPKDWQAFWSFWCDKVQPALRQATGNPKLYGLGLPVSTGNVDTDDQVWMFLYAHDAEYLTPEGKLLLDQPKVRQGIVEALGEYAAFYKKGCTPPESAQWKAVDNNLYFHNQAIVATINTTLSIPLAHITKNPDNYYAKIATIPMPNKLDGQPMPLVGAGFAHIAVFKRGKNVEGAKDFLRWLLGEGRLASYVEASTGRFLPAMPELTQTPFWRDPKDPHRAAVLAIAESNLPPQLQHERVDWRLAEERVSSVWPKAVTRVALDGWTAEQAADEAIARIKQILAR